MRNGICFFLIGYALISISACKNEATDCKPVSLYENSIWPNAYEVRDAVYKGYENQPEKYRQVTKDLIKNWKLLGKDVKMEFRVQISDDDCSLKFVRECKERCKGKEIDCVDRCIGNQDYSFGCFDWWNVRGVAIGNKNISTYLYISIGNGDGHTDIYLEYHPKRILVKELETPAQDFPTCRSLRKQTGLNKGLVKKLFKVCQ